VVRVNIKGVHRVKMRLRSGQLVFYYYAWRGGPRLIGEPGSPEFLRSLEAAHALKRKPNEAKFLYVINRYRTSKAFERLKASTQRGYKAKLKQIEEAFGDLPLEALADPRITDDFLEWRDDMADSPRQADYAWTILMRTISWARDRGLTTYRPPDRVDKLHYSDRSECIWERNDIAAFKAVATPPLQYAMDLAIETGQRQADLLALPWSGYDGTAIVLRQKKSERFNRRGRKVRIPVRESLRAVLDQIPKCSPIMLTDASGQPWDGVSFRRQWSIAAREAGTTGLRFHDLRGTTVTRMAEAGCTVLEIASITGHSLRDANAIVDRYLARTDSLSNAAIAKLERADQERKV
jgi:integrase